MSKHKRSSEILGDGYISPQRSINRLLALAEVLRSVPRVNFDIEVWGKVITPNGLDRKLTPHCNTAGCIAGWTTAVAPELRFALDDCNELVLRNSKSATLLYDSNSDEAGAALGLTEDEADTLFLYSMSKKKTPQNAAKAVEALAKEIAVAEGYDIA